MDTRGERRRLLVATIVVVAVAIAHRVSLILLHRADLHALAAAKPHWYARQNLRVWGSRDHHRCGSTRCA